MPPRKYEILHMGKTIHTFYDKLNLKKKLMLYKQLDNKNCNIEDMHVKETSFASMESVCYKAQSVIENVMVR